MNLCMYVLINFINVYSQKSRASLTTALTAQLQTISKFVTLIV